MKNILLFVLLIIAQPFCVGAQNLTPQDSLLNKLTGNWVLHGTIEGKETTHDVTVSWVLEHQYLQINEVSREKNSQGSPEYTAIVYLCWEQKAAQYSCLWLDNTGNTGLSTAAVGHATYHGNQIPLEFKSSDGSSFFNTFSYNPTNHTWRWKMEAVDNGNLVIFADVTLVRK